MAAITLPAEAPPLTRPPLDPAPKPGLELDVASLDPARFAIYSTVGLLSVRAFLHPINTIKTRLQVIAHGPGVGAWPAIRTFVATEGIRGLYRGYAAALVGVLPAQGLYVATLEITQSHLRRSDHAALRYLSGAVAGGMAAAASALVAVPLDVVSQRQMVSTGHARPVREVFSEALARDGIRGLWRGYGATLATYAPSSALWWGTYGFVRRRLVSWSQQSPWKAQALPAICGTCAAIVAAVMTQPLDVAKTRLQTSEGERRPLVSVMREIYRSEGLVSLWTRGLAARVTSMVLFAVCMSTAYEAIKYHSRKR